MKSIFRCAFLFGAIGAMLTSCSNDDIAIDKGAGSGKTIHMTVSALRESDDAESRTSLSDKVGGLSCVWTAGDKILVTDSNGKLLGSLLLNEEDDGKKEAEFSGDLMGVDDGTQTLTLNYFYLGTKVGTGDNNYDDLESGKPYVGDFSIQPGTFESLSDKDILTTSKSTVIDGNYTYFAKLGFQRRVSFAHFKMNLPEGATYPVRLTIVGKELNNTALLSLSDQTMPCEKGEITIENVKDQNFYITYLPTADKDELSVTAVDAKDNVYVGKYEVKKAVEQNKYFRKSLGDGQYEGMPIYFEAVENEYSIRYEDEAGNQIYAESPKSADDIKWTVRNDEKVHPPYEDAPEGKEFDKWKIKDTNLTPEIVTLSKGTPSYIFVPTWKDKATVNVTWKDGYTEGPIKTEYVKVGENEEKPIGDLFPETPTREGYIFDGWEIDGKPVDPADVTVTKDDVENGVVITARWKVYTITTPGYGHGDFNN